jgi:hypothetical protein
MAEWIRRFDSQPDVMLYTYGAPRVGDKTFVREASELTHHRLVNNNDPVPGAPSTWMDAEWKAVLAGSTLMIASRGTSPIAWSMTIGGLVNLEGDDYQHHGEQRHFMPRKAGGGSEKSILWQPKSATFEMNSAAKFAADIALEQDMPKRKSFVGTVMSAVDHTLISGYGPAALASLLRWVAAAWERDGQLFTAKESKELLDTLDTMRSALRDWQPGSYLMFKTQLTRQPDLRFSNKSEHELKSLYDQDIIRLNTLKADEEDALRRARKRLNAQSEDPISREDVFGDTLAHEQFDHIVGEWLALADVKKAQRLAKAGPSTPTQVA